MKSRHLPELAHANREKPVLYVTAVFPARIEKQLDYDKRAAGRTGGPEFFSKAGLRPVKDQRAATRLVRRLILRAAVFLCITPRATPRASSGCADLSAD